MNISAASWTAASALFPSRSASQLATGQAGAVDPAQREAEESGAARKPGQESLRGQALGVGPEQEQEDDFSPEELKQIEELKARDREVRDHEQAHLAAAAGLALSGATFSYQRGPDGANYAIGGEVRIDTSPGQTPEETIRRAQSIRAAALAPAEPSGPDRAIAAEASQMEAEARAELAAQKQDGQGAQQGADPKRSDPAGNHRPNDNEIAAARQARVEREYGASDFRAHQSPGSQINIAA